MNNNQQILGLKEQKKYIHRKAFLKPTSGIQNWNSNGEIGYISTIGKRLMVYRNESEKISGYLLFDSENEMKEQFSIRF